MPFGQIQVQIPSNPQFRTDDFRIDWEVIFLFTIAYYVYFFLMNILLWYLLTGNPGECTDIAWLLDWAPKVPPFMCSYPQ